MKCHGLGCAGADGGEVVAVGVAEAAAVLVAVAVAGAESGACLVHVNALVSTRDHQAGLLVHQ